MRTKCNFVLGSKSVTPRLQNLGIDGLIIEQFIPLGRGKEIADEVLSQEEGGK